MLGLVLLAGCGGSGSTGATEEEPQEERLFPWVKGPARGFISEGGDNAVPTFGQEAIESEREQASRVVAAWMRARAATNWAKDCSYFSRAYIKALVADDATHVSNGRVKNCPQALAYFGELASGDYKNTLSGPIDSLRVEGTQGYALYHGRGGRDWTIPMDREDGKWWVAIASPVEREK